MSLLKHCSKENSYPLYMQEMKQIQHAIERVRKKRNEINFREAKEIKFKNITADINELDNKKL